MGHDYISHDHIGTCYALVESSRRGGHFERRHIYTRAMDMPSAMPKRVSKSAL